MSRILVERLWPTITALARKSKHAYVAVAYLGLGANRILPLHKGAFLVVDMSEKAVKNGQTNPYEIEKYFKKGVNLYTCANLHAKVYVFDDSVLVASANISLNSKRNLIEAGVLCRDADSKVRAIGWIKSLQLEPITPEYIKRCKRIYKPPKITRTTRKQKHREIPEFSTLWLLSVSPTNFSKPEQKLCDIKEKEAAMKVKDSRKFEVNTIRWDGNSRIAKRIREGDLVVQIWNEGKDTCVYPPSRVVQITQYRSFDIKKKPMLFIHIEEPKKPNPLPWTRFAKKMGQIGVHISRHSQREIRQPEAKYILLGMWRIND
ncbi:MAG: phospholipase D family protein [Nitrososphaeria archaeon]